MNWNVITPADVHRKRALQAQQVNAQALGSDAQPPAPAAAADSYMEQLLKYVPPQVIGAYVLVEGILKSLTSDGSNGRRLALSLLLALGLALSILYATRLLGVVRWSQRLVIALAFVLWVFAIGGVFATLSWWKEGWGTLGLVAFGVFIPFLTLPPLPDHALAD